MIAHSKSEAKRLSALTGKQVEYIERERVDVLTVMRRDAHRAAEDRRIDSPSFADEALEDSKRAHAAVAELIEAAKSAEAALSDIGDADREPGDDVAWCERRAYEAIPRLRAALARVGGAP